MTYRIRYTPRAQRDMDAVWDSVYEASGEFDTADQYVDDFICEIAGKKNFPKSGIPVYYRGLFTGYYAVIFKAYKAFYRIVDDYIEVLRIIMMKEDYMEKLFDYLELSSIPSDSGTTFQESSKE